jgi:lipoprotein-anchoring transpeptidase ErfK/SrfK
MRSDWQARKFRKTALLAAWLGASLAGAGLCPAPANAGPFAGTLFASLSSPGVPDTGRPHALLARVDLSEQKMRVYVDDRLTDTFAVSTGRGRYHTPTGNWRAQWLSPHHRSKKYHNAPMPWSVFFYKGYAIHGTTDVSRLGQPASHGCVRLHPDNAKIFYDLVQAYGKANTRISVVD